MVFMSTTPICLRSMKAGTGMTTANSLGSPSWSLAMVTAVLPLSQLSTTFDALLKSLLSALAT